VKKDAREIMEILEAFDLIGCAHSAGRLVGCDPKTVRHWVELHDRGFPVAGAGRRARLMRLLSSRLTDLSATPEPDTLRVASQIEG